MPCIHPWYFNLERADEPSDFDIERLFYSYLNWLIIKCLKSFRNLHYKKKHRRKSSIIKVLIILFGHLREVEFTYRYIFALKVTLRSQQPDIVPIICHRCHWHYWQICRRCGWYRWQIATGFVDTVEKVASGIVNTGGKFATGINNTSETGGTICHRCRWYGMGYSGVGRKQIHEKNKKQKILLHSPFQSHTYLYKEMLLKLCRWKFHFHMGLLRWQICLAGVIPKQSE